MNRKAPKPVRKNKGPQLRNEGGRLGDAPDAKGNLLQLRRLKKGNSTLYIDPELESVRRKLSPKKVEMLAGGGEVRGCGSAVRGTNFKGVF